MNNNPLKNKTTQDRNASMKNELTRMEKVMLPAA